MQLQKENKEGGVGPEEGRFTDADMGTVTLFNVQWSL